MSEKKDINLIRRLYVAMIEQRNNEFTQYGRYSHEEPTMGFAESVLYPKIEPQPEATSTNNN